MKKIIAFAAAALFLASCTKQDSTAVNEEGVPESSLQNMRKCASSEILEKQIAENPARGTFLEDLEEKTKTYPGRNFVNRANVVLYVPVVVHIVSTNPNLVSTAQIASQIAVLNKDFRKTNTELSNASVYLAGYGLSNVPDCKIQFVLKQTIRKQTSVASFSTNDAVKRTSSGGSSPVNATTWLNLWVCDLSSGLLGYAQFPGGSSATDGVVIDYQGFGTAAATTGYSLYSSFNLGRTTTHEIGHWFNLRHIWGDRRCGNDQVSDTPAHDDANGGCPSTSLKSQCNGKPLEQWMNYMDYTDDRCMYMFSAGQKTRMDAAIDLSRGAYVATTP